MCLAWCLFCKDWPQPLSLLILFLPFQLNPILLFPSVTAAGTKRCTQLRSSGQRKVVDAFFSAGFVQEDCATAIQAGICYMYSCKLSGLFLFFSGLAVQKFFWLTVQSL